jgi:hypothetical protein
VGSSRIACEAVSRADGVGFEPTVSCPTPHFECGALDHYATRPREIKPHRGRRFKGGLSFGQRRQSAKALKSHFETGGQTPERFRFGERTRQASGCGDVNSRWPASEIGPGRALDRNDQPIRELSAKACRTSRGVFSDYEETAPVLVSCERS